MIFQDCLPDSQNAASAISCGIAVANGPEPRRQLRSVHGNLTKATVSEAFYGVVETSWLVIKMYVSNRKAPHDSPVSSVGDFAAHKTIVLLDELLTHTLPLRDLYKSARCQATDIHLRHLRPLFATHYEEQLALVDMLVDRIRALGGASRVLAGAFLPGTPPCYALRGHIAPSRLLCDLLEAHETVMSTAHTAGAYSQQIDPSAVQDFAVGQVLLTNDQQGCSVREQLVKLDQARRFAISSFSGVDAYE